MAQQSKYIINFAQKGLSSLGTGTAKLASSLGVVAGAMATAVAGAKLFTSSVREFSELEKGIREIGTLTGGLSSNEFKLLEERTKSMSIQFGQTFDALTKANYDIVSAGFTDMADSVQILEVANKLAVGGVTDVSTATDALTSVMNAYGAEASDAGKFSNVLFTTVQQGKTTIPELAASLGAVAPIARGAGFSLGDLNTILATTTASGINTAESATGIKAAIQALTAPMPRAAKQMDKLGISVKKLDDGSIDLDATFKQFVGMPPDVLKKLIPSVQASSIIQAVSNNMDKLRTNVDAFKGDIDDATDKAFDEMAKSWDFKMKQMSQALKSFQATLGNVFITGLLPTVTRATEIMEDINKVGFMNVLKNIAKNADKLAVLLAKTAENIGQFVLNTLSSAFTTVFQTVFSVDFVKFVFQGLKLGLRQFIIWGASVRATILDTIVNSVLGAWNQVADYLGINKLKVEWDQQQFRSGTGELLEVFGITTNALGKNNTELLDQIGSDWSNFFENVAGQQADQIDKEKEKAKEIARINKEAAKNSTPDDNGNVQKTYLQRWQDTFDKLSETIEKYTGENAIKLQEEVQAFRANYVEPLNSSISGVTDEYQKQLRRREQDTLESLRATEAYQEADADGRKKMERDATRGIAKEKMKLWKLGKLQSLTTATMNIAEGVTKALAMGDLVMTGVIAGLGAVQLGLIAGQKAPKFAKGGQFITNGQEQIIVGDNPSGKELVQITPLGADNAIPMNQGSVNISFSGNILSDEFIMNDAIPKIKDAIRRGDITNDDLKYAL